MRVEFAYWFVNSGVFSEHTVYGHFSDSVFTVENKRMSKKVGSMRILRKSKKCYADDFKNKKIFFLTLLDYFSFQNFSQNV